MKVKEITLLSAEEYVKHQPIISIMDNWWWLRSPGTDQYYASYVDCDSFVRKDGTHVTFDDVAVRPALKLELEVSDNRFWYKPEKLIGTKIEHGGYNWTILDASFGNLYVLCDEFIAEHRFDPKSNDWDTSELKQWLETEGLKFVTS